MDVFFTAALLAICLAGLVGFLRWRFAYLFQPPLRIGLERAGDDLPGFAESYWTDLQARGFDRLGAWRIKEMPGVALVAFTQTFQKVTAVVYRHPVVGVFADVYSENDEGESLTMTSAPTGQALDQPPGRPKLFDRSLTIGRMYDLLLKQRPRGPYKLIDGSNFAHEFERAYTLEMAWRAARGGVTEEEVRRTADTMGIRSDETIRKATQKLQKQSDQSSEELQADTSESDRWPG